MKKSLWLLMLVVVLLVAACGGEEPKRLEEIYKEADIEHVDQVVIYDGSTGYSKTFDDEVRIAQFLALINPIVFTPHEDQSQSDGWRYSVTLYDGDRIFSFTNMIGNKYYDTEPNVYEVVHEFYTELDVAEK